MRFSSAYFVLNTNAESDVSVSETDGDLKTNEHVLWRKITVPSIVIEFIFLMWVMIIAFPILFCGAFVFIPIIILFAIAMVFIGYFLDFCCREAQEFKEIFNITFSSLIGPIFLFYIGIVVNRM